MIPQAPPSIAEELVQSVIGFPKFAIEWVIGLIIAILTDLHIASLAVTGLVAGFVFHSVLTGVFVFFLAYSISRIVSYVANAIGTGLGRLADATYKGAVYQPQPPIITVEEAPPET